MSVYRRMGWTVGVLYWKVRTAAGGTGLRLQQAALMAKAVGAELGPFLAEMAEEEGIPSLKNPEERKRSKTSGRRGGSAEVTALHAHADRNPVPAPHKRRRSG